MKKAALGCALVIAIAGAFSLQRTQASATAPVRLRDAEMAGIVGGTDPVVNPYKDHLCENNCVLQGSNCPVGKFCALDPTVCPGLTALNEDRFVGLCMPAEGFTCGQEASSTKDCGPGTQCDCDPNTFKCKQTAVSMVGRAYDCKSNIVFP